MLIIQKSCSDTTLALYLWSLSKMSPAESIKFGPPLLSPKANVRSSFLTAYRYQRS